MIHLFPSRLTRHLHELSTDCPCSPYEDPSFAIISHNRLPEEANPMPTRPAYIH